MKINGDKVIFETTGREAYANCGILGIDDGLEVHYGYDGVFERGEVFTSEERSELAEHMKELWSQWAIGATPKPQPRSQNVQRPSASIAVASLNNTESLADIKNAQTPRLGFKLK